MSDFYYSWRDLSLYSVQNDLKDIFKAVMARYEQMKLKARLNGESEQQLLLTCRESMEEMRTIYQNNLPFRTRRIDFTDRIAQWCYMYLYMLRHVHLVHHALKKAIQEKVLRVKSINAPLDVCMIGGGPGSDILGICLLMKEFKCRAPWTNQVFCLDACSQWELSWRKLYSLLPKTFQQGVPAVMYSSFNYRENNLSASNLHSIKRAEVITMIKSLSSAAAWLKNHRQNYINPGRIGQSGFELNSVFSILKHMQPGAILLYVDNKSGCQREVLMTAAKYLKMDVLLDLDLQEVRMPTSFLFPFNRNFSRQIGWNPCSVAGYNEMIILRKPGHVLYGVKLEVTVPNFGLSKYKPFSQSAMVNHNLSYNRSNQRNAEYVTDTSTLDRIFVFLFFLFILFFPFYLLFR